MKVQFTIRQNYLNDYLKMRELLKVINIKIKIIYIYVYCYLHLRVLLLN